MKIIHPPNDRPLVTTKVLRFAPSRQGRAVARMWKVWAEGKEVYATCRVSGNFSRISVHASGQIHMHMGGRDVQGLAPPLLFDDGRWQHAFELRFLISTDAHLPPPEKLKKKSQGILIELPPDAVLLANLLIAEKSKEEFPVPPEFATPLAPLWKTTLSDGRIALLVGRLMPMDDRHRQELSSLRHTLNPRLNLTVKPERMPYLEIHRMSWHPTNGNVVLIVPMGDEGSRVLPEPSVVDSDTRTAIVQVETPSNAYAITAPDGARIGTLTFSGVNREVSLEQDREVMTSFGTVSLDMHEGALVFGERFRRPSIACRCPPRIGGVEPNNSAYRATTAFDGESLTVDISQLSSGLRRRAPGQMSTLADDQEILITHPVNGLRLSVTRDRPQASAELSAKLRLTTIAAKRKSKEE